MRSGFSSCSNRNILQPVALLSSPLSAVPELAALARALAVGAGPSVCSKGSGADVPGTAFLLECVPSLGFPSPSHLPGLTNLLAQPSSGAWWSVQNPTPDITLEALDFPSIAWAKCNAAIS